jgi:lipopolysaccharide biosynthesis protein
VWVEGADGEVEFPPGFCTVSPVLKSVPGGGKILNYPRYVSDLISGHGVVEGYPHPVYRGAMLGWDNSPRKEAYHSWYGFSPEWYYRWLRYNIEYTRKKHAPEDRFIFINAWNEWAEGTYLEPDRLFGYTNLNATSKALFDMPLTTSISKGEDMENVDASPWFDRQWYLNTFQDVTASGMDPLEHFAVAGWKEGRSPSEYFPSGVYLFFNPGAKQNPHSLISEMKVNGRGAEYIKSLVRRFEEVRAEVDARLKLERIIPPALSGALPERKIAVHLHCFYDDMIPAICEQLNVMPYGFDLLVSVPEGRKRSASVEAIGEEFRKRLPLLKGLHVEPVPNRGRDIAPMLCTFGKELSGYDYICHIHTKKSPHTPAHAHWAEFIYRHLFGSRDWICRLLGLLEKDAGLICPPDFLMMREEPSGWGSNIAYAQHVLDRAHVDINLRRDFPIIEFPQGSMFWARTARLKPMFELDLRYEDFPPEPLGMDGSIAHGVERLLMLWGLERPEKVYQVFMDDEGGLIDRKRYWYRPPDK